MKLEISTLAALALAVATGPLAAPGDGAVAQRAPLAQQIDSTGTDTCIDSIAVAPVLNVTSAGYTLAGASMNSLQVYSNGLVVMSQQSPVGGGSQAQMFNIGPQRVRDLQIQLEELDADSQCDARTQVYDVPLTTVTVYGSGATSRAHSYSYWIAEGSQQPIEAEIQSFIHDIALREAMNRVK